MSPKTNRRTFIGTSAAISSILLAGCNARVPHIGFSNDVRSNIDLIGRKVPEAPDGAKVTPLSDSRIPEESLIREAVKSAIEESPAYIRVNKKEKKALQSTLDSLPKHTNSNNLAQNGWYMEHQSSVVHVSIQVLD
ncbi:hypothetical protein [Haloferax sp. Atlit-12N]|uniref:hypothetical protein n=1 Tax=Haloferax sp. Atlit-12N TaxID=2077203 RepID=UPI0011E5B6B4|nr:hypothetical protein [Haloferax sp. Atlit-12N]